jgi:photosystem II stability/assembly factor-like uncharacterized protein
MSVHDSAREERARPCMHSQHLLSEDAGTTWRRIHPAVIGPAVSEGGRCALWSTSRRLFMHTYVYSASDPGQTFLQRSDDGGLSWARADQGLAEQDAIWYAQPLDAGGDTLGALLGADLWITQDAGASWRRAGLITLETETVVGGLVSEASVGGGPRACRCVYVVVYSSQLLILA